MEGLTIPGTLRELYCLIARFVLPSGYPTHRLLGVAPTKEHAVLMVDEFLATFPFSPTQIACVTYSDAIPAKAMDLVRPACHLSDFVVCFRSTLLNTLARCATPQLSAFVPLWIRLLAHSADARGVFGEMFQQPPTLPSPSRARDSTWETIWQLLRILPELRAFLLRCTAIEGGMTSVDATRCLECFALDEAGITLQTAAVVDLGLPMMAAYNKMEGDTVAIDTYDIMFELQQHAVQPHTAHIQQQADALAGEAGPAHVKAGFISRGRSCLAPAQEFLQRAFHESLQSQQAVFEACTLCNPCRIQDIPADAVSQLLTRFKDLSPDDRKALCAELDAYKTASQSAVPNSDVVAWWRGVQPSLPHWSKLARVVLLFEPSTVAGDSVANLFDARDGLGELAGPAAMDAVRVALMCRFNDLQRRRGDVAA